MRGRRRADGGHHAFGDGEHEGLTAPQHQHGEDRGDHVGREHAQVGQVAGGGAGQGLPRRQEGPGAGTGVAEVGRVDAGGRRHGVPAGGEPVEHVEQPLGDRDGGGGAPQREGAARQGGAERGGEDGREGDHADLGEPVTGLGGGVEQRGQGGHRQGPGPAPDQTGRPTHDARRGVLEAGRGPRSGGDGAAHATTPLRTAPAHVGRTIVRPSYAPADDDGRPTRGCDARPAACGVGPGTRTATGITRRRRP